MPSQLQEEIWQVDSRHYDLLQAISRLALADDPNELQILK